MDVTYELCPCLEFLKKNLNIIRKKIVTPTYTYPRQLYDAFRVYFALRRLLKKYWRIASKSEAVERFQYVYQEIYGSLKSIQIRSKRLKENRFPLSNQIYNILIEIIKLADEINEIDIDTLKEKEAVKTTIFEKQIASKPYPMLISMGYYILLFVIIMILTIIKVIPLVSSILGGLIGISYFSTALHDYMLWRKKYGK